MQRERNEYELALWARDGDREALAELVERTRLRLVALAYAELRRYEDAQDAVAAALLQICWHVTTLREPERIHAWMQSIVRNEARRLRRGAASRHCALKTPTRRRPTWSPLSCAWTSSVLSRAFPETRPAASGSTTWKRCPRGRSRAASAAPKGRSRAGSTADAGT